MSRRLTLLGLPALTCVALLGLQLPLLVGQTIRLVPSAAYPTIDSATLAAVDGDTIEILPGTYHETIDFHGKSITVRGQQGPTVTIIDGDQVRTCVNCIISSTAPLAIALEGVTIRNGQATTSVDVGINLITGAQVFGLVGGGMIFASSSFVGPAIKNCIFLSNNSFGAGGAIGDLGGPYGTLAIEDCDFIGNVCQPPYLGPILYSRSPEGAAISLFRTLTMSRCRFINNIVIPPSQPNIGAFDSQVFVADDTTSTSGVISNCEFVGVGGVGLNKPTEGTIENCTFQIVNGIGLLTQHPSSQGSVPHIIVTVANCQFEGCDVGIDVRRGSLRLLNSEVKGCRVGLRLSRFGHCLSDVLIANCQVGVQIGIVISAGGNQSQMTRIERSTIVDCGMLNPGQQFAGSGFGIYQGSAFPVNVVSSILWGSAAGPVGLATGQSFLVFPTVTYTDIDGTMLPPGPGNISLNPLFVDPANGDYHLQAGSPCRDSGSPAPLAAGTRDIDGEPRTLVGSVDMGADEFLLGPHRVGSLIDPQGQSVSTLSIDGNSGTAGGFVGVQLLTPFVIGLQSPSAMPRPFILYGRIAVPDPSEAFAIGSLTSCIIPFHVVPHDPWLFVLANSLYSDPAAFLPASPAPWIRAFAGLAFPARATLQAAFVDPSIAPPVIDLSNAIVLDVSNDNL